MGYVIIGGEIVLGGRLVIVSRRNWQSKRTLGRGLRNVPEKLVSRYVHAFLSVDVIIGTCGEEEGGVW